MKMTLSLPGQATTKDRERTRAHDPALVLQSYRKRAALSIPSLSSAVVDSQMNRKMPARLFPPPPAPLAFEVGGVNFAHHHPRPGRHSPIRPPLPIKLLA